MTIEWLPLEAVLIIHAEQLDEHGGAPGIRDEGLLRSALARPQNLLAYQPEAGLARLAACYAYGIARNHAFVDGNKRVALLIAYGFLALNGQLLDATNREAERMVMRLAAGEIDEPDFAEWIDRNLVPIQDR